MVARMMARIQRDSLIREDNSRYIPIKFSVRGRDLGGTVAEAQAKITQNLQFPQGYYKEDLFEVDA